MHIVKKFFADWWKRDYQLYNAYQRKNKISQLIFWILNDFFDLVKAKKSGTPKKVHLYGIYGFFGLMGQGKTMAMTYRLYRLRKKYGDRIYIVTNYGFALQDEPFTGWQHLLQEFDKPVVFAWDEVQNEFNSRDFKNFPVELLTTLTQVRKNNGIMLLYSAQRWGRVDRVFRELTSICYECKTRFGRLSSFRGYHWEEYEQLLTTTNVKQKAKIRSQSRTVYVQTDYLRSLYDSYKMLKSAKEKQYLGRDELAKLNSTN